MTRSDAIRVGYKADLIVVNGNPLENFKVLSPLGIEESPRREGSQDRRDRMDDKRRDPVPRAYTERRDPRPCQESKKGRNRAELGRAQ
jgi:hypothetical protein